MGQRAVSEGDCCSFRHDDKRGKVAQPNPSPNSFMQQNVKNASRTRSPRGRSPSWKMARLPCKDYLEGTCTTPLCGKWHPPECLFYKSESGCRFGEKCSYAHRQVDEQPSERSRKNGDKSAVAMLKSARQVGLRMSRYGAPEVHNDSTEELRHTETDPTCSIHKSGHASRKHSRPKSFTRIDLPRSLSAAPTLQNLRIALRRRQSGKSKVPVKQRGEK